MKSLFLVVLFLVGTLSSYGFNTSPICPDNDEAELIVSIFAKKTLGEVVTVNSDGTLLLNENYANSFGTHKEKYLEEVDKFNTLIKNGVVNKFTINDVRLNTKASNSIICRCTDCPCGGSFNSSTKTCCSKPFLFIFCLGYGTCP